MQKHVLILLAAFGLMFVSCIAQSVSRNCDLSPLEAAATITSSAFGLGSNSYRCLPVPWAGRELRQIQAVLS